MAVNKENDTSKDGIIKTLKGGENNLLFISHFCHRSMSSAPMSFSVKCQRNCLSAQEICVRDTNKIILGLLSGTNYWVIGPKDEITGMKFILESIIFRDIFKK